MTRKFASLLLFIPLFTLTSCVVPLLIAGGAGAGGYAYANGSLSRVFDKGFSRSIGAVKSTLKSRGMPVVKMSKEENRAKIKSEFADGKKVTVTIKKVDNKSTQIGIRVGVVGDKTRSINLMKGIERRL